MTTAARSVLRPTLFFFMLADLGLAQQASLAPSQLSFGSQLIALFPAAALPKP